MRQKKFSGEARQKIRLAKVRAGMALCMIPWFFVPNLAYAKSTDYDFLTSGQDSGMFSGLTNMVKGGGVGLYTLAKAVGVVCLMLSIIFVSVAFFSSSSSKIENAKSRSGYIVLGGALIFGVMGIIGLLAGIGGQIG